MAKYQLATPDESRAIRELEAKIGGAQLRSLLTPENREGERPERVRIMGKRRLANLSAGSGRLTVEQSEQLRLVRRNMQAIENLTKRGDKQGHQKFRTNRAIRTWLQNGKKAGAKRTPSPDELRAIKALRFLGVDVSEGIFYIK